MMRTIQLLGELWVGRSLCVLLHRGIGLPDLGIQIHGRSTLETEFEVRKDPWEDTDAR